MAGGQSELFAQRPLSGQPEQLVGQQENLLFHLAGRNLGERELQKFAVLEEMPFQLEDVLQNKELSAESMEPSLLVVLYQQTVDEKPLYFSLPLARA